MTGRETGSVLSVGELSVRFAERFVLHGIDVTFPVGKITALIGPTGAGKTTLLRALNRLHDLRPHVRISGKVLLHGRDIYAEDTDVRDLRRRVGMLFQRPNPFPQSILDNVRLAPRVHGMWQRKESNARAEALLRDVGLWDAVQDRLGGTPYMLSGGQQQLLCLARALAVEPEVLLLDEPTSSLDPRTTNRIENLVTSLRERVTTVFVTHNLAQASRTADYVLFMEDGRGVEFAPAKEFFNTPRDERSRAFIAGDAI